MISRGFDVILTNYFVGEILNEMLCNESSVRRHWVFKIILHKMFRFWLRVTEGVRKHLR
jgi:hypothetical protein